MSCKYLISFLLVLVLFNGVGQPKQPAFHHLTRDNGLSSNRVNCIIEDNQGFMWFGTEDGLNKFNGYDFEIFRNNSKHKNSIPNNSIDCILEDAEYNSLWLATRKGLVYFDGIHQNFELVLSEKIEDPETGNISINALCYDKYKRLWIGNFNGLFIYNTESKQLTKLSLRIDADNKKYQRIFAIYRDKNDVMWLGCENGLYKYNESDGSFTVFNEKGKLSSVQVIMQDHNNGYWVGSDKSGLFYYEQHPEKGLTRSFSKETGHFEINRVHEIIEDEPGKIYIMIRDGGLYYLTVENQNMMTIKPDLYNPNSINSTALISGFKSSNGMLWLGTYNSGINYIDKSDKKFMHYKVDFRPQGLLNNNIRALFEDSDGIIWVGTKENGGLSKFNPKNESFKNYRKTNNPGGLNDDYIFSICELNANQLLIGTFRKGLAVFDKKTEKFNYYTHEPANANSISDNRVYSIFKDKQNDIWIGNYDDLQHFNFNQNVFTTIKGIERPRCFLANDDNTLWIGSKEHGLYLYNKATGKYINYLSDADKPESISSNDIYGLAKDKDGNLWIGTKQGINKYDKKAQKFVNYTEANGLPANWICGLLIDEKQNVWVSTSNGIAKLNPENNEVDSYDIIDGLQGNEFEGYVALKSKDGHMIFGGRNGFNYFLPQEITDNTKKPEIVLTGFRLFNKEVPIQENSSILQKHISFTQKLTLKHNESAITFDYAALNYTSPEKNKYAYMLEGLDGDWVQAGTRRSAVYTNIPPGDYTFKVIGSNNDNYWNTTGKSIQITILNPYWKTRWAYFAYFGLLVIAMYFIRKLLIYRIEQKNLLELERIEKTKIQEMNQMKLRFFTNISHEFRTPLTLISAPLNKLMTYKNHSEEQNYLYKIMKNNVQRLLGLVNELMDFRKAEQGQLKLKVAKTDLIEFLHQIIDCFESTAKDRGIDFQSDYQLNSNQEYWFDKRLIDKVVFNLLSNAFKYTPQNGIIKLNMSVSNGQAKISISDSGQGIPKEKQISIFDRFYQVEDENYTDIEGSGIGLAFSKRLIEVHKGTIKVESELGKGSVFSIEFPVDKTFYNEQEIKNTHTQISELTKTDDINPIPLPDIDSGNEKSSVRLLIVEDNSEMRNFLQSHFSDYDLLIAENGKLGYQIANSKVPDLIISDIMMPVMNGLEMCKKLKTQFATSHIPIILLTAKSEISQKIEGIDTGADAYIEKPFNVEYLESRVKNLLLQREVLRKRYAGESDTATQNLVLNVYEKKFMDKAKKVIDDNIDNSEFSVEDFGYELGLSRSQLFRKFKSIYALKPSEFIRNERLKASKILLLERNYNVNEISELVGFKSASYFITSFKKFYGKTPAEFVSSKK